MVGAVCPLTEYRDEKKLNLPSVCALQSGEDQLGLIARCAAGMRGPAPETKPPNYTEEDHVWTRD